MKHLRITYGDLTLFDGDVEEINWTENANGVAVTGKTGRPAASGGGLLELLAAGANRRKAEPAPKPAETEETDA